MAKSFDALLKKLPPWFSPSTDAADTIVGSMARAVHNLPGHKFPGWSTAESRKAVAEILLPHVLALPGNKSAAFCAEMSELSYLQRRVLLERKQISHSFAARQDGCHVVINGKQDAVFMINEEEHLVMHLYSTDINYEGLFKRHAKIADTLSQQLSFATHNGRNVTSMPSEAGAAVQLYTVMHLPALATANMMSQVQKGIEAIYLSMSPFYHDMTDNAGNLFVIYTAPIPHGEEEEVTHLLHDAVALLTVREMQMRRNMLRSHASNIILPDAVNRAYGLLRYACRLHFKEYVGAMSMLKLGIVMGFIAVTEDESDAYLKELSSMLLTAAPHHMEYQMQVQNLDQEQARVMMSHPLLTKIDLLSDLINFYAQSKD